METLKLSLSYSTQDQSRHSTMICPLQSVISDTSISFDNGSLENYFHEDVMTSTHVQIQGELSSLELPMMEKGTK